MGTNKVFAVFGLGTFGLTVAETLTEKGATVIAIDSDENQVNLIKNKVDTALVLDTTDERAMEKAPLDEIDTAVIALGEDLETSIITTALIKKRGIPIIIARAVTSIHEQVLRQIGATEIVNLQRDGGERLAQKLVAKEVLDTVPISGEYSVSEIEIPKGFFQEKPENMALKEKFGIRLIGVKRQKLDLDGEGTPVKTEYLVFAEDLETFQEGDIGIILGENSKIKELEETL